MELSSIILHTAMFRTSLQQNDMTNKCCAHGIKLYRTSTSIWVCLLVILFLVLMVENVYFYLSVREQLRESPFWLLSRKSFKAEISWVFAEKVISEVSRTRFISITITNFTINTKSRHVSIHDTSEFCQF